MIFHFAYHFFEGFAFRLREIAKACYPAGILTLQTENVGNLPTVVAWGTPTILSRNTNVTETAFPGEMIP